MDIPDLPDGINLDVGLLPDSDDVPVRILRRSQARHLMRYKGLPRNVLVSLPTGYMRFDFIVLTIFSYANGPQTIALFGLGLHRFPALLGTLTFMTLYASPSSPVVK